MEMTLSGNNREPVNGSLDAIANSNNTKIRFFNVKVKVSEERIDDIEGEWLEANFKNTPNFSAVAYSFAKYLNQHVVVTDILKRVALVIFVLISVYFFITAKKTSSPINLNNATKTKQSRFLQGMFLSAINIFPIPFQAYVVTSLLSVGWLELESNSIGAYIAGAAMGSFIGLYIYILFFFLSLSHSLKI